MNLIEEKLAEIARKSKELEDQIAERVRRELMESEEAKTLADNAQTLIKAAQILGIPTTDLATIGAPQQTSQAENRKFSQKWPIPIGDAIEKAILNANQGLSLDAIEPAIAEMGVKPSRNSIRSTLSQDKKRFKRLDTGVYDLVSRLRNETTYQMEA